MRPLKYMKYIFITTIISSMVLSTACQSNKENTNGGTQGANAVIGTSDQPTSVVLTSNNGSAELTKEQTALMKSIKEAAVSGKVIEIEYGTGTVIEDVIKKYGEPSVAPEWFSELKGIYIGYNEPQVSFGYNKGSQIFEIKRVDDAVSELTKGQVEAYFGKPDHSVENTDGSSIGYMVSKDYRLIFNFGMAVNADQAKVMSYSVLQPSATVNIMADDAGREW